MIEQLNYIYIRSIIPKSLSQALLAILKIKGDTAPLNIPLMRDKNHTTQVKCSLGPILPNKPNCK